MDKNYRVKEDLTIIDITTNHPPMIKMINGRI